MNFTHKLTIILEEQTHGWLVYDSTTKTYPGLILDPTNQSQMIDNATIDYYPVKIISTPTPNPNELSDEDKFGDIPTIYINPIHTLISYHQQPGFNKITINGLYHKWTDFMIDNLYLLNPDQLNDNWDEYEFH